MSLASVSRGPIFVAMGLSVALASPIAIAQTDAASSAAPASASASACAPTPVAASASAPTAASAPAPTSAPTTKPAEVRPLTIWLDRHGVAFDSGKLQAALEHELARPIVITRDAAAAAVQIRLESAAHAEVHYTTPSGEQLSRGVELPPDRERSVQIVSWLTVNLVRDEAAELLDQLRARRKQEADARAAEEQAAAQAAADQAAADQAAADKAAAAKAAADAARSRAERAKSAENAAAGAPKKVETEALLRDPLRSFDAALATPLSLLHDSPRRVLRLQLALGYGDSGAIEGIAVATGALRVRRELLGMVLGVGAAFVGGDARGLVGAVGYSEVDGNLDGVQLGVGAAVQRGRANGVVLAAGGAMTGDTRGVVIGVGFTAAKALSGIQIAGGANTAGELDGIAIAPVNVHRRVKGIQFGVVNVAEQVDGAAIGVVSVAKNGRVQPVVWGMSDGSVHVALKSIAGYVFTQVGAGIDVRGAKLSYDGGIGAHLELGRSLFFEPAVHYSGSQATDGTGDGPTEHQLHYLAQVGVRLGDKLDLVAAAGVSHTVIGGTGKAVAPEVRAGIAFF